MLLGEQGVYELFVEPKIENNKSPQFAVTGVEFSLAYEDGTEVQNGLDIVYSWDDSGKFFIKTAPKVSLLGTKLRLTSKVIFEEKTYDNVTKEYITKEVISENIKEMYIGGW